MNKFIHLVSDISAKAFFAVAVFLSLSFVFFFVQNTVTPRPNYSVVA